MALDPRRAYGATWEEELGATGALVPTAVVLLTNKQCPFECVMCDLWVHTLDERVPSGAIPTQIRHALASLMPGSPPATPSAGVDGPPQIKLYNAGSFFDPAAIPPVDDRAIARALDSFDRVIVESHPAFLAGVHGERCLRFRDALRGRLEVAIGLEAADDEVLARMNKRMTLESFGRAAEFLNDNDIDLRAFILLNPPFVEAADAIDLACRSIDFAREHGAVACSVIPTRPGNDAMPPGFRAPRLSALEHVVEFGICAARRLSGSRGGPGKVRPTSIEHRVFADLWDIDRFFDCSCSPARAARLAEMNRTQRIPPPVICAHDC